MPLQWNLTKTLNQVGASIVSIPEIPQSGSHHSDTIPDRFRSLQASTFLSLHWWVRAVACRGHNSCNCQLSIAPLFITLAVITTVNPVWALAKPSPAKTPVICGQDLDLFLPWDSIHLISTTLGSCWLPCLLKRLQIKAALCSFTRPLHSPGTGVRTW